MPDAFEGFFLICKGDSGAPGQIRVRRDVAEKGNGLGSRAQDAPPQGVVNVARVSNPPAVP
eukprot:134087-Lingulodinium_polyedra.AAC.1